MGEGSSLRAQALSFTTEDLGMGFAKANTGQKTGITTECSCDLPLKLLKDSNIDIMYYFIRTDEGRFREGDEITSVNVFEHHRTNPERPAVSVEPTKEEFFEFFKNGLGKYDEVIHIAISSKISMGYQNAVAALELLEREGMGGRVHIFDSQHLSTGIGYLALYAAKLAQSGTPVAEILDALQKKCPKVSTIFMADSADYLYRNGKVGKGVMLMCNLLHLHPILEMRNGCIRLKSVKIGDYKKCALRHTNDRLKDLKDVRREILFITHAGCTASDIRMIRSQAEKCGHFDRIEVTTTSATISCNSGPRTFGLLYVNK